MRTSNPAAPGKYVTPAIAPALLLALFASAPAMAGNAASSSAFQDTARVVASTPIYESINQPRRECWEEEVRYETKRYESTQYEPRADRRSSNSNVGSTIFGGLVGGVLGNSVGKGDGRKAATAIGAALGAIAGDNYADNRRSYTGGYVSSEPRVQVEQRCREVDNWSRKLTGYDVTYRYQGHEYTTFMPFDPGSKVRVNVNVSLAEQ
jgi:uncharacterized protein YcfJ